MRAAHLEFLTEEPSAEAFVRALMPRLCPGVGFRVSSAQGKLDLMRNLEARLRAYASWLPDDWRVVILVDRDDDDCRLLKKQIEDLVVSAGLRSRSRAGAAAWQVVSRIAIEELEAWYFGDWAAVRTAFPRAPADLAKRRGFRDPDAIAGGTWEAFERVLRRGGYFKAGLQKISLARTMGQHLCLERSRSGSFVHFCRALREACSTECP